MPGKESYEATSIDPWNDHPARDYYHLSEECPLLQDWQGQTITRPMQPGIYEQRACPFCSSPEQLAKSSKAYRGWLHYRDLTLGTYMRSFLEGMKTEEEIKQDAEKM